MSLEVKSNKELKKIRAELFYGMGIREIAIFSITAVVVGFIFIRLKINAMIICYVTAPLIAAATLMIAFKPCGMLPEQLVLAMFKAVFINKRKFVLQKEEREAVAHVIKSHRKAGLHETEDTP